MESFVLSSLRPGFNCSTGKRVTTCSLPCVNMKISSRKKRAKESPSAHQQSIHLYTGLSHFSKLDYNRAEGKK